MLDAILIRSNLSVKLRISVKAIVSALIIALAVALPQIVHLALGAPGGVKWLPMYLPVLIGGCVLGWKWGLGVGILSPIVSYLITMAAGNPMPALERLPFMVAELAVFAGVSGLFSKYIPLNPWMAFPAVLLAAVGGRAFFLLLIAIFQSVTPFTVEMIWGQIQTGLLGLLLQAVLVPFIVMLLTLLIKREKSND